MKKVRAAAEAGNLEEASSLFRVATKELDQAAAKNLIHKNKASRLKSRLATMLHKKESGDTGE